MTTYWHDFRVPMTYLTLLFVAGNQIQPNPAIFKIVIAICSIPCCEIPKVMQQSLVSRIHLLKG